MTPHLYVTITGPTQPSQQTSTPRNSPVCTPLHPQEEGNIPYVVDNGVGAFETDPAKIAQIMARWLDPTNKEEFHAMARRSKALGRPRAVYNIAKDLAGLVEGAVHLAVEEVQKACCGCGSKKKKALPAVAAA